MAFCSWPRGMSIGKSDWRPGASKAAIVAFMRLIAYTCQNTTCPVTTKIPSASDVTTDALCVIRRSRRRSTRSATVPPMSANAKIGAARNTPFRPSRNGESVS